MTKRARAAIAALLLFVAWVCPSPSHAAGHVFVTTSDYPNGNCAAIAIEPPWTVMSDLEPVGAFTTVRHFFGFHWVVSGGRFGFPSPDEVQVIDPVTFETVRRFSTGVGSNPLDIALVDPTHAWISRYDSTWLLEVDAVSGAPLDSVDLGGFSDADGLPEMAWMALDGTHLFVQIQRIDRDHSGATVPPALLAVVDVSTRQLIDVDPGTSGIQGIALIGPEPQTKMQIEGRQLFVSTPGKLLDFQGGVEIIDLDTFDHLGFLIAEADWSIDMGAFVLVSPMRGYTINHTDFALSSHLDSFDRPNGDFQQEHYVTFGMVESLVDDPLTDQLFFPDPTAGMRVFRSSTGDELGGPIATGLPPRDLILFRPAPTDVGPHQRALSLAVTPNPFQAGTLIAWTYPGLENVQVTIHDIGGRLVRRLAGHGAGVRSIFWDGRDDAGRAVPAGVYIVRASAGAGPP